MRNHILGFKSFSRFYASFCTEPKLATISIRVNIFAFKHLQTTGLYGFICKLHIDLAGLRQFDHLSFR